MKKALIFDAYDDYSIRIRHIKAALERNGYEVKIFFADFDHVQKRYYVGKREDVHYIHTESYEKNLSVQRLISHYRFARACVETAEKEQNVSLIYVMVPPNSMAKQFAEYKKKHPEVKLWFDVLDMWPESLPVPDRVKKLGKPALDRWRYYRDGFLKEADLVTPECDLFRKELEKYTDSSKMERVYLSEQPHFSEHVFDPDAIHFLYCGSINHLIDIQLIGEFLWRFRKRKKVTVDIVGGGENLNEFFLKLKQTNVSYRYHGYVYDEKTKNEIYSRCNYGLNCMKDTVFVGLTMKSMDYLSHSLPLINNIAMDSSDLVEQKKIGFNISFENIDQMAAVVSAVTEVQYRNMCENVEGVFRENFTTEVIDRKLDEVICRMEKI